MTAVSNTDALQFAEDLPPLRPEDVPVTPLFWSLIVEPLQPKNKSAGGIYIADQAQEVEKLQCTVGRVIKVGSQCFKGKTSSGLVLADDPLVIAINVGSYVLFARHTGQHIKLRQNVGKDRVVIVLSDTELLCVVEDPDRIRFWV